MLELAQSRKITGVLQMRSFESSWGAEELRRVHRSDESSCGYVRLRRIPAEGSAFTRRLGAHLYDPDLTVVGERIDPREGLEPRLSHTSVSFPRRRDV